VRQTFRLRNLRPLDGERAENWWDVVCVEGASLGATELSKDHRASGRLVKAAKRHGVTIAFAWDIGLRGRIDDLIGDSRHLELNEGDVRMDCHCVTTLRASLGTSLLYKTPNPSVIGTGWFIDPRRSIPGALLVWEMDHSQPQKTKQ
jgi:hypothetical protein